MHALDQEPLRKRFADEIVGAHFEAEQFVDLVILRGEEDHRQIGFLPEPAQKLHAVHARHFDIEDREVWRICLEAIKRGGTVCISLDAIAFTFKRDGYGCENVAVVIDQCDRRHSESLFFEDQPVLRNEASCKTQFQQNDGFDLGFRCTRFCRKRA